MAVVKHAELSRLMIKVQTGVDATGKPVLRNRTFSGVKAAATDQDVYDVAAALSGLQEHAVDAVLREDNSKLVG